MIVYVSRHPDLRFVTKGIWLTSIPAHMSEDGIFLWQKMHIENVFLLYGPSITVQKGEKKTPSGFC